MGRKDKERVGMKYVAIILAGQLRQWNLCSSIFKSFNNLDSNLEYHFFLSSWYDKNINDNIDFSFLKSYQIFSPNSIKHKHEDYRNYPFLLKQVNRLKNLYEREYSIDYNYVISTRPDIFLSSELLKNINSEQAFLNDEILLGQDTINIKKNKANDPDLPDEFFTMHDWFIVGTKKPVDIHANIYDDMYKYYSQPNYGVHITPAMHLIKNNIRVKPVDGFSGIIREDHKDLLTGKLDNICSNEFIKEFKLIGKEYVKK